MKKYTSAFIFGIAIMASAYLLGNAYVKRAEAPRTISVTGLGNEDFTSDLIVWDGTFSSFSSDLKTAFDKLNEDKNTIADYLVSKGIKRDDIIFNSVNTSERRESNYLNGSYVGSTFRGYDLSQSFTIESKNVNDIEKISREVTELLNKGLQLTSQPPRYYYTKLADLKIEMISKATEDARVRAEKIAKNGGSNLGKLKSASMGVFQITGQNTSEEYSWGGHTIP